MDRLLEALKKARDKTKEVTSSFIAKTTAPLANVQQTANKVVDTVRSAAPKIQNTVASAAPKFLDAVRAVSNPTNFAVQKAVEKVATTKNAQGQNFGQYAVQQLKNEPDKYNFLSQIEKGNIKSNIPALDAASRFASSYLNNRIVKPAASSVKYAGEVVDPNNGKTAKERLGSAAQSGIGALTAASNIAPTGMRFTLPYQAYEAAKGADFASRKGTDRLAAAMKGFTGEKVVGLGESQTDNPLVAGALDVAEFAGPLMMGGIKPVKGPAVANLTKRVHPDDVKFLNETADILGNSKMKGTAAWNNALKNVQALADEYLPKDQALGRTNEVVKKLLAGTNGYKGATPNAMNLVTDAEKAAKNFSPSVVSKLNGAVNKVTELPEKLPKNVTPVVEEIATAGKTVSKDVSDYVQSQVFKQKEAAKSSGGNLISTLRNFGKDLKTKIVDQTAAIEDTLTKAEKEHKFKVLPTNDIRYQIDRALRSDSIATQFIKDNGMVDVVKSAPDIDELGQYLIAKQAGRVGEKGIETGRDLNKDSKLVSELSATYEPYAAKIKEYTDKLLDYKVQAGFVSPDLAAALRKEYPDYVPLNRVFDALEETGGVGGGLASVGTQKVLQKLKGSTREIRNPIESLFEATGVAFKQGERNKAAQQLVSYKDLPGNPFQLRQLVPGEVIGTKPTISAWIDGKKVTYETTKDIEEAAKGLTRESMNILGKIMAVPTRLLQVGAVGLNLPFVASNLVKDQITANVLSSRPMATSLANPINFVRSAFAAINQGKLYDDWVRSGAAGTSFDIARDSVGPQLQKIRSGKNMASKISYTAKNPKELLAAVENMIGKAEEVTRIQQFEGTRQALLKEGRTAADANILAANASRNNTTNFARRGTWGTVLNGAIPFFNAGIQGARALVRAVQEDPKGAAVRFGATIGLPVMTVTAWNMADPARKKAYDDIPDYEKENNLIILPENPTQDEKGNWNAIKIPMTPGISNLASIIRRQIEGTQSIKNVAGDILAATTSIDPTRPRELVSKFTPQILKPGVEALTNKNLFTGNAIVPEYMKNLPPENQYKDNTSGTLRKIGAATGTSPLMLENGIKTAFGGLGSQGINAVDTAASKAGIIPEDQIGGQSTAENLQGRFVQAKGGKKMNDYYDTKDKRIGEISVIKDQLKSGNLDFSKYDKTSVAEGVYRTIADMPKKDQARAYQYVADKLDPEVKKEIAQISKMEKAGLSAEDRELVLIPVEVRSKPIVDRLFKLGEKNRKKKYEDLVKQGVITEENKSLVNKLIKERLAK